jgi:hypothetical protein
VSSQKQIARAIREYLDTVKGDVIADLNRGINATGAAKTKLRVVENQYFRAQLRGVVYMPFLYSFNKKQSPKSVGREFIDNIIIWMKAKRVRPQRNGLTVSGSAVNYRRAAFSIAKGITESGNKYKKTRGVDMTQHLKDNKPELLKDIGRALLTSFTDKTT